jgi:hypothetical protein
MPRVEVFPQSWGSRVCFHCPGCNGGHAVSVRNDNQRPAWIFNGDVERPTIAPSILVNTGPRPDPDGLAPPGSPDQICHSYVTAGRIQFLADSTHALAGQIVDLPEID